MTNLIKSILHWIQFLCAAAFVIVFGLLAIAIVVLVLDPVHFIRRKCGAS